MHESAQCRRKEESCILTIWASILAVGCYLVQDVDVVVLSGEGGVAVAQSVHHGAAGDDDGCEEGADAVLKGWELNSGTKLKLESEFTSSSYYTRSSSSSSSSSPARPPPETLHTAAGCSAETRGRSSGRAPRRSRWL